MTKQKKPTAEYRLVHNPGYDFVRLVKWMEQIDPNAKDLPFAPYMIPIVAILAACCAVEGYTNMVGQKIDLTWGEFDRGPIPLKRRISRIYDLLGKKADFSHGVWWDVRQLFIMRVELVHPRYIDKTERRKDKIPDVFQTANAKYPPTKSGQIAEKAIDTLLADSGLSKLKERWQWRMYSSLP